MDAPNAIRQFGDLGGNRARPAPAPQHAPRVAIGRFATSFTEHFLGLAACVVVGGLRRRRKVVGRIGVEESVRFEQKPNVGRRHDRIVFRARNVGVTEGVPEYDIAIGHRTIVLRSARRTVR